MPTFTGTDNGETLTGGLDNDLLEGLGGDDILIGAEGDDVSDGGDGNDQHQVDSAGDIVIERSGEGDDDVITSVSYVLAPSSWVETLRTSNAASTAPLSLWGNEVAQSIYGNAGNNVLGGGAGNDYLVGLEGNDYLIGGGGADVMLGGTGNDTYTVDLAAGDIVTYQPVPTNGTFGGLVATVIDPGDGQTITIFVDGQNRTVPVGTILASDNVLESPGEGEDVIVAYASYVLRNGIAVETLVAAETAGGVMLRGNDLANSLYGNSADNYLFGHTGDDYLVGLGGNDLLDGSTGADVAAGGTGNDTYWVDNVGDRLIENVGEGFDTVEIRLSGSVDYFLAPGVEVETLVRPQGFFSGTPTYTVGNEFTQTIVGNDGQNRLAGGGGADTLSGQGNNDIYDISDGREIIIEGANGGDDIAYVSTNYTLNAGAQVETISTFWQFGTGGFDISGNEFGQRLIGDFGSNILDGKGGTDTLVGLGGADIFAFTTALGSGNVDKISDFQSGIDTIALDDAIFSGLTPGNLPAGAFATGIAATEADDRIIYDPATGKLYFDADGVGGAAAVQFATLDNMAVLQASDFLVV